MYMNGNGIHERTRRLTDDLWNAVGWAIVGSAMATAGPLIFAMMWFIPGAPMVSPMWVLPVIGCAAIGLWLSLPWWRAKSALRRHTASLDAETEKRGCGWARS